jgi:hypothetical protein
MLIDLGDQMGTGMSNVAGDRSMARHIRIPLSDTFILRRTLLHMFMTTVARPQWTVLKERVNHDIALSSERDEVDRKKRHAADTTHFLFDSIYSLN